MIRPAARAGSETSALGDYSGLPNDSMTASGNLSAAHSSPGRRAAVRGTRGRLPSFGRGEQGRHPLQTTDALE